MKFKLCLTAVLAVTLVACQPGFGPHPIPSPLQTGPRPTPTTKSEPAETRLFTPTAAAFPQPSSSPTLTGSPTFVPTPAASPGVENQPGALYKTIFTIPVGEEGVQVRGVGIPDMEITGPDALAVLADGSFVVADLIGNRLLRYDPAGHLLKTIDLYSIGIVNVADLRATATELLVLEISFKVTPERYRVSRLSLDGRVIASYDIPGGFHLENGLTGIAVDCTGEVLLEMDGGSNLHRFIDAQGNLVPASTISDYHCNGRSYRASNPAPGITPSLIAGSLRLETQLTHGFGGLRLLDVLPDGSFYVLREDVVTEQVIKVDQTVHYISADGVQQGVARVPLAEYYYYVMRNLATGPDGQVYALFPQPDSVQIIRLNFYKSLQPLIPGAAAPLISASSTNP